MSNHSIQRTQERYNMELTDNETRYLIGMINAGNFLSVTKDCQQKDRKHAYVKYKKIPIHVVYAVDKYGYATEIVTALPFNVEEYNEILEKESQKEIENCINFLKINGYIVYKRRKLSK